MSDSAIIALAAALTIALSTVFPALAQGKTARAAMESIARQPEAAHHIPRALPLSMALLEAPPLHGLLIAFLLVGTIDDARKKAQELQYPDLDHPLLLRLYADPLAAAAAAPAAVHGRPGGAHRPCPESG